MYVSIDRTNPKVPYMLIKSSREAIHITNRLYIYTLSTLHVVGMLGR